MKITKKQLRRIIREEREKLHEIHGVIAGVGFGSDHRAVPSRYVANDSASPASLAVNRYNRQKPKVSERYNPAITGKLRRDIVEFVDQYMIGMGMNSGDSADLRRVRRTIDDVVHSVLGEDY